jgi:hypothetical protein
VKSKEVLTMNIPGFTAEVSLYYANRFYWRLSLPYASSSIPEVIPQARKLFSFWADPGCLCLGVEDDERGYSYVAGCVCP